VNPPAGVKAIRNAVNSVKRYNLIGCVTHEQNAPRIIFMKGPQVFHEVILNSLAPFSSQKRKDFLSACHEQPCAPPESLCPRSTEAPGLRAKDAVFYVVILFSISKICVL
jgi:hypothetical protein